MDQPFGGITRPAPGGVVVLLYHMIGTRESVGLSHLSGPPVAGQVDYC